jgi:hypothetical protein
MADEYRGRLEVSSMAQGARVIDLDEYRRRRQASKEQPTTMAVSPAVVWIPLWMWVPAFGWQAPPTLPSFWHVP